MRHGRHPVAPPEPGCRMDLYAFGTYSLATVLRAVYHPCGSPPQRGMVGQSHTVAGDPATALATAAHHA